MVDSLTREENFIQLLHALHVNFWSPITTGISSVSLDSEDCSHDCLTGLTTGTDVTSSGEVTQEVMEYLREKYVFLPWISPMIDVSKSVNRVIHSLQDHHRNRIFIYNLCQITFNHIRVPSPDTPASEF